jgi:outer membrane protein TolC/preprotein translocase subunit SecF
LFFSHGFSAIVALILVPTVRLQLLQIETKSEIKSPIEKYLKKLEEGYGNLLGKFLSSQKIRMISYAAIVLVLVASIGIIYPNLRKEVIGKPDTDWVILSINTEGNTLTRQMESRTEEIEKDILKNFAPFIQYTFTQVESANGSEIMLRLKDKSQMKVFWKQLEEKYKNQPLEHYWVGPWNPSELPIPDPDHLKIEVKGGTSEEQQLVASQLENILNEKKVFPKIFTSPSINRGKYLSIEPYNSQWLELKKNGFLLTPSDLIEMVRVATQGKKIDEMPILERATSIQLKFPDRFLEFPEEVSALPIGTGQKIIPLRALAKTELKPVPPSIRKEQQKRLFVVSARENNGEEDKAPKSLEKAKALVADFKKQNPNIKPTISFEDPAPEITQAMQQLTMAVGFSILIIFIVLVFQFGTFIEPLLVMVSIPLGFIGVFLSLFIFQSSLSLNSILGIILLNGISVANSILLVDFIKRLKEQGLPPRAAAITAAQKRLRPILITSVTTVLGMLPMALGFGEGGKILQPLGIAVSGGLWMSMLLTLFLVPALHVAYLNWDKKTFNFKKLFFKTATASLFFFTFSANAAISFEDALDTILNRNPQLEIQKNTLEKEKAASLPSKLFYLPTLSLEGSTQINNLVSLSAANSVTGNLKWNLFKFGADYQANSAYNLSIDAESESYKQTWVEVEYLSVKAISEVIQSHFQNKISEKFFEFQKKASQIAEARYQAGRLPLQELEKLRIDNNNAKASFQDTKIELTKNEAVLLELLGDIDIEKKWFWKEALVKPLKIFSKNISEQPGLLAAKKKWEAAQKRTSSSFRKILPSLDLAAFYGYQTGGTYTGATYGGGLTLTLPLFDKLAQYSDYRVNYHSEKSLEATYTQYKRKLEAEWEALKKNFETTLETTLSREENLQIAKRLYTNAEDRFRKGLTSANELTVDQTRLYNAELYALKGWANLHILFAESCKTAGLTLKECLKS